MNAVAREGWRRWDTLGLRLFVLMWVALVVSHFAAFSIVTSGAPPVHAFDEPPDDAPFGSPGPPGPMPRHVPTLPSLPPGPAMTDRPRAGPGIPMGSWLLDYAVRLLVIGAAAWWGSRWLARPVHRLVQAADTLDPALARGQAPPRLDEGDGTREVREAADVFNRMASLLQARFEERGLMIAAISHDLRTPLTRMRLRLEGPEVSASLRERCSADIGSMNSLIDSVLEVFRPDAPTAQNAATRIDLAALAQSAVDDLADGGADVGFEGPHAVITARPLPLRRVLDNLIGNALRYAGQARVCIEHDAHATVLAVEDDGPGIPPAELERVLQPFRRVESSRNPATGGAGLGLYIASELARREGATLRLANRPQGGLRAELRWPADDGSRVRSTGADAPKGRRSTNA